jgi:hypothetical protein
MIVYYWLPPTTMDAVFGHHCCQRTSPNSIKHKVDKDVLISKLFIDSTKTLQQRPQKEHVQGRPPLRRCGFIKITPLEGQTAPSPWWWCLMVVCVVVYGLVTSQAHRM